MFKFLIFFFIVVLTLTSNASSAPNKYFLMCVDCSQGTAQTMAKNHIRSYPNTYLEQKIYVYTNTGGEYGYSFNGIKEEWLSIAAPINSSIAVKALYKGLHDYVEEYNYMINQAQAVLDAQYLMEHGFAKSQIDPKFTTNYKLDCDSPDTGDSPFDYFKNNMSSIIDSKLNALLKDYKPTKEAQLQTLGVNAGFSSSNGFEAGASATISIVNAEHVLEYPWSNGGVSRFVVSQNAGQWSGELNLAGSRLGNGLYAGETGPGASLDEYVIQNADGSYSVKGGNFQFENDCLEKDFEDMLESLGLSIEYDESIEASIEQLGGRCAGPMNGPVNYRWSEVVQTYVIVGNRVIVTAHIEERSLSIDLASANPCIPQ